MPDFETTFEEVTALLDHGAGANARRVYIAHLAGD